MRIYDVVEFDDGGKDISSWIAAGKKRRIHDLRTEKTIVCTPLKAKKIGSCEYLIRASEIEDIFINFTIKVMLYNGKPVLTCFAIKPVMWYFGLNEQKDA